MKNYSNFVIALTFVIAYTTTMFAQIPNAGFETWSNTTGYNMPTGWDNLNAMTAPASVYTCAKGTPGSPGTAYIKLVSKNVTGMGVMPGVAVSGTLDVATMTPTAGFAYDQRPTALAGKWQHMASGNDEGFIAIYFTKWNPAMQMRDTVGSAMRMLGSMAMSWATFNIPIVYTNAATPDSCVIILSASGTTPVANSYLYVDNLSFTGVTVATQMRTQTGNFRIFPNPATTYISIDISALTAAITAAAILDVQGKIIQQLPTDNPNWANITVQNLPQGNYFLQITTQKGIVTQQFNKQ
jgi:hypothetical protein